MYKWKESIPIEQKTGKTTYKYTHDKVILCNVPDFFNKSCKYLSVLRRPYCYAHFIKKIEAQRIKWCTYGRAWIQIQVIWLLSSKSTHCIIYISYMCINSFSVTNNNNTGWVSYEAVYFGPQSWSKVKGTTWWWPSPWQDLKVVYKKQGVCLFWSLSSCKNTSSKS